MSRRRRLLFGATGVIVIALGLLLAWPSPPPGPTGTWMAPARAGVEPRFETVDRLKVRYVRRGQGPAIILLHGFASSIYSWAEIIPALAESHDVVALDFPGFGGSEVREGVSALTYADLVPHFMDRLGIARATLVGNSLGGGVAAAVATLHPERVDRLVLIDAAGFNLSPSSRPWMLRVMAWRPVAFLIERLPVRRRLVTLALHQVFFDPARITTEKEDEYVTPLLRPGTVGVMTSILRTPASLPIPALLPRIQAPTLVIWGRQDRWIPVAHADLFVAAIPGARKVVLDQCGHVPQEERPRDVIRLIEDFLGSR